MDILAEPIEQVFTTEGELPIGFLFASVKNLGSRKGTLNGIPLEAGEAVSYPFVGKGYKAVPFNAEGTEIKVLYII